MIAFNNILLAKINFEKNNYELCIENGKKGMT